MAKRETINPGYLQPGASVGAYEIVDLVGHGGFGFLYRVKRDKRIYALKISRDRLGDLTVEDRLHAEERLDREILAVKSLRHPNIVRVHAFERWPELDEGFPYLVMDFIEGPRVYDWRTQTSPSLRSMCDVMKKIASAVDYMHKLNLFHRDIKSENILVRSADSEPILVDFGIARPRSSYTLTRAQTTLGTISHYAPEYAAWSSSAEFFKGLPFEWKATTDLHSVGYIFYELICGFPPFPRCETENEQLHTIQTVVPEPPSVRSKGRVPACLDAVVMKLLEKQPEARFQTGRDLAEAIREVVASHADDSWDQPFDIPNASKSSLKRRSATPVAAPTRIAPSEDDEPSPDDAQAFPLIGDEPLDNQDANDEPVPDERSQEDEPPSPADRSQERGSSVRSAPAPSSESRRSHSGTFNPPTTIRPSFTGIRSATPASPQDDKEQATPETPGFPTAIRRQAEQLSGNPKKKPSLPLLVGGILVLAVAAFMLIAGLSGSKNNDTKRADLLAAVEQQRAQETSNTPPPPPPQTVATPIALADGASPMPRAPEPAEQASPPTREPEPTQELAPPPPPVAQAHSSRSHASGGGSGQGSKPAASKPSAPDTAESTWLHRSQRVAAAATKASGATGKLGVPYGTQLKVKLLSNLDSRTIGNAPVSAMLAAPFFVGDQTVLPARTFLYGQGIAAGGRFTIQFTKLRLPDNTEMSFQGIAMDHTDGKAGLVAARTIAPSSDSGPSLGGRIARGSANTVLGQVNGGVGHDIVRGAGTELVNNKETTTTGGTSAILLDAPVVFDVFITNSF